MDKRRKVIVALGVVTLVVPIGLFAQQQGKVWRLVYLHAGSAAENGDEADALRKSLGELGYIEGRNIRIEMMWAEGRMGDLPSMAAEVVRTNPDIILAQGGRAPAAVQQATKSIPIVGVGATDPASNSNVASMARPGSNFTGTSNMFADMVPKWIELAHEIAPHAARIGILMSNNPTHPVRLSTAQAAARALHVALLPVKVNDPVEFEGAFARLSREAPEVLVVFADSMFFYHRATIIALAARYHLPAVYPFVRIVTSGGLIGYGASVADRYQGIAHYVDKILRGARPGDLPIEQPTKVELVINLKTASALGLKIPQSLLLRADEVIQ